MLDHLEAFGKGAEKVVSDDIGEEYLGDGYLEF